MEREELASQLEELGKSLTEEERAKNIKELIKEGQKSGRFTDEQLSLLRRGWFESEIAVLERLREVHPGWFEPPEAS